MRCCLCTHVMPEQIANAMVSAAYAYVAAGLLFATAFLLVGVKQIDHEARGSGFAFRLFIAPGVIALWPLLAHRWASGESEAPIQKDPHR